MRIRAAPPAHLSAEDFTIASQICPNPVDIPPVKEIKRKSMKTLSFGLATVIAIVIFGVFGSVGARAKASVSTHVASMYAVLPDGTLVDLRIG